MISPFGLSPFSTGAAVLGRGGGGGGGGGGGAWLGLGWWADPGAGGGGGDGARWEAGTDLIPKLF